MNLNDPDPTAPTGPPALSGTSFILRLLGIGAILGGIVALFLYVGGWLTPAALTPTALVNVFEAGGKHPGFRRNHAKGVGVSGYFESNGQGASLSKALIFLPGRVPVLGRFALGGGQPDQSDSAKTVRSMALQFTLPDGEEWRTGMNNIPVFPVQSPQGFYDLLKASAPDPTTGQPNPEKMAAFQATHPESVPAMKLIHDAPLSSGFSNSTYNSLDAFRFVNAQGVVTSVRWAMVPVEPSATPQPEVSAPSGKNYLFEALIDEIKDHPRQWHLIVTVAQSGDPTNDATLPWPKDRTQVDVGTLTIDHVESEETSPVRDINFDPLILPAGIEGSDDPLLSARSAAYANSFRRREGEPKTPSAVSPTTTDK